MRRVSRIKGRTHVSTRPRAAPTQKILLAPKRASTHVAKFWRLRCVEDAGGCVAWIRGVGALTPAPSRVGDADVGWASQVQHAVEHMDRDVHLGGPTLLGV